jgi:hypothetical protein
LSTPVLTFVAGDQLPGSSNREEKMTSTKSEPATLIERAVTAYIGKVLRSNALLDPPIDALRFAAASLLKLTGSENLRKAQRDCADEFCFRLEMRLTSQDDSTGRVGATLRHVHEFFENHASFRLMH